MSALGEAKRNPREQTKIDQALEERQMSEPGAISRVDSGAPSKLGRMA
jgi:hypothetical protein